MQNHPESQSLEAYLEKKIEFSKSRNPGIVFGYRSWFLLLHPALYILWKDLRKEQQLDMNGASISCFIERASFLKAKKFTCPKNYFAKQNFHRELGLRLPVPLKVSSVKSNVFIRNLQLTQWLSKQKRSMLWGKFHSIFLKKRKYTFSDLDALSNNFICTQNCCSTLPGFVQKSFAKFA